MIQNNQKTSLLVPSQLPEFIRGDVDYSKFVLFLQAYYEWMEQEGNALDRSSNLLNYSDIDATTEEFLQYFTNEFLQYFPKDALLDQRTAVKIAKQLYQHKGTPSSYQFLFRILYNIDFDVFYTKDAVLRASDGEWYVTKSLKLSGFSTNQLDFLNLNNYRIFGETTKSIAVIETSIIVNDKVEVFISDIERLFQSGETVRIIDNQNQDVLVDGQKLTAKIVGQISQVKIDPTRRGLLYKVGDPVIVYGGLSSPTGLGALAQVGSTTSGAIQKINVVNGGYGYREDPNTIITITNAPGASANVSSLDPDPTKAANVRLAPIDTITLKRFITIGNTNYNFSNIAVSNANTTLVNAFAFSSFMSYPISSLILTNGGGGISQIPTVGAQSVFQNDTQSAAYLSSLGILAPIQIVNGGRGYVANDKIVFSGGSGYGAFANVTNVASNGAITKISYVQNQTQLYPFGGMGYRNDALPTLSVQSANVAATGAVLVAPGILGDGATFAVTVDRVGAVTTINLLNGGEDYIARPNVSLKVQDIVVSNVSIGNLPAKGDVVYQGANINVATYIASVNSVTLLSPNEDPDLSLYAFRVFNYSSKPNSNLKLKIDGKDIVYDMANTAYDETYDTNGVKNYGDGNARANATFLNGLVISDGKYLSSRGQPSSFSILQDEIYNNYTYQITVEKEISKYREVLMNLLHPTGMQVLGRYALKANTQYDTYSYDALYTGKPLSFYTGYVGSTGDMVTNFANRTNLLTYSEQFDNAAWGKANSTIAINQTASPTGTTTADKIQETAVTSFFGVTSNPTGSLSTKYTWSCYVKAAERQFLFLNFSVSGVYGIWNLTNGTTTVPGGVAQDVGNGWWRLSVTFTTPSSGSNVLYHVFGPALSSAVGTYSGVAGYGVYVWGAQLESSTQATTYIPTTSAAVTVGPDNTFAKSNNIVTFNSLGAGVNIATFIFANSSVELLPTYGPSVKSEVISINSSANTVTLKDNVWLTFANVANITANAGSNVINIVSLTGSYDIINNKQYSNTSYPLMDIVFAGDKISIANNTVRTVQSVNYTSGKIVLTSNLTANSNSLMTVNRTVSTNNVKIWGPVGTTYVPELITQSGNTIITQDGKTIILG